VRRPHNGLKTSSAGLITATRRSDRDIQMSCSPQSSADSEISSSHRASGVPAGVRSVPRWRGVLWRCRSLRPPCHDENRL